jgi:DNA mismatch endonuclease, patch repair protein
VDDSISSARSLNMSRIRSRNTGPELFVRRELYRLGIRFRIHRKDIPGVPDIAIIGLKVAIFVHGCFWHRHANCKFAYMPRTRQAIWSEKLSRNRTRDLRVRQELLSQGWRVAEVWECAIRSPKTRNVIGPRVAKWINGKRRWMEIRGPSQ